MIKTAGPFAAFQGIQGTSSNRSMLGKCTDNAGINLANHLTIKEVVRHASTNNLVKLLNSLDENTSDNASSKSDVISSFSSVSIPILKLAHSYHLPILAGFVFSSELSKKNMITPKKNLVTLGRRSQSSSKILC